LISEEINRRFIFAGFVRLFGFVRSLSKKIYLLAVQEIGKYRTLQANWNYPSSEQRRNASNELNLLLSIYRRNFCSIEMNPHLCTYFVCDLMRRVPNADWLKTQLALLGQRQIRNVTVITLMNSR